MALTAETLIEEKEVTAETLVEEEEKKGEKQEEDGFTVVTYKKSKAKKNKLAAKKAVLTAETLIEEEGKKSEKREDGKEKVMRMKGEFYHQEDEELYLEKKVAQEEFRKKQDAKKVVLTAETLVKEETKEKVKGGVNILITRMPEGVRSIEEAPEWEEIQMAVDSGATESVVGEDMLTNVKTEEGESKRKGIQYETADGTLIENMGEKKFVAVDEGGTTRKMTAQVTDVSKPLLSVSKIVQAGKRVVFAKEGSYVEDDETGERMYLKESGGMYMLKLWVKRSFPGQGANL